MIRYPSLDLTLIIHLFLQIIGPGVVGIGLLGNVLNLLVLTRPSLKGVTYTYLIGLACSDIGVLLCAVPMMVGDFFLARSLFFRFAYLDSGMGKICTLLEYRILISFLPRV